MVMNNLISSCNRAGSVLTETEEPAVFDDFLGTETEIEPISAEIRNRE